MGAMSRVKSYNSKKLYVQGLINAMQDVFDLATAHDLIGELHYGPQLGKIVALLENHNQNGWYKILAEEKTTKPARWERMITYLNSQLNIIQLRAFECESDTSSFRDKENGNTGNKDTSKVLGKVPPARVNHTKDVCKLCGDTHNKSNTNFVYCRKFLLMTCKERANQVRKGKYCFQCLCGKTKFHDPSHSCADTWVCKHNFHDSYQYKLHFLLCAVHATEDNNKQLFERFKVEILTAEWQKKIFEGKSTYVLRGLTLVTKFEEKEEEPDGLTKFQMLLRMGMPCSCFNLFT